VSRVENGGRKGSGMLFKMDVLGGLYWGIWGGGALTKLVSVNSR